MWVCGYVGMWVCGYVGMDYGLWIMDYGLWIMVYGLWIVGYDGVYDNYYELAICCLLFVVCCGWLMEYRSLEFFVG